MVISVMFEVIEYTLEHQLPNFSECWWDHVRLFSFLSIVLIQLLRSCDFGGRKLFNLGTA